MKKNVTTTEKIAVSVREAVEKLNAFRALGEDTLTAKKSVIADGVSALASCKDEDTKILAKESILKAVADYNTAALMLTVKNLNATENALDVYLSTASAGVYSSAKFTRNAVTYEDAYVTASEWASKNRGLKSLYDLAMTDPSEKNGAKSLTFPEVVPASLAFQGAIEVLQVLCVRTLDFVAASPVRGTDAPSKPTNAQLLAQVNKVAELITGKNEDLYSWASKAVLTFSATYRAKKRMVKGAGDSDFINLIFDIIRQKRVNIDKMAFTSKASAFREAK